MRGTQSKRSFLFEFPLALDHLRINIRIVEKTELITNYGYVVKSSDSSNVPHRTS